jgi:hypothetical protein
MADKQVICLVVCNQAFVATSTGWGTASSITGSTSAATATVTAINLKSYNISDKVIWGGYSWTNVAGL